MHLDTTSISPVAKEGGSDILISNYSAPELFDLSTEYSIGEWTENKCGLDCKNQNDSSVVYPNRSMLNNKYQSSCITRTTPDSLPDLIKYHGSRAFFADNDRMTNLDASDVCKDSQFTKGSGKATESSAQMHNYVDCNRKVSFYIGDEDRPTIRDNEEDTFNLQRKSSKRGETNEIETTIPKNETEPPPEFTTPDGGFGWIVAMSACIVNLFVMGMVRSYGVLYVSIAQRFPESSAYEESWVPVLLSTTGLLLGPVTGVLCRKFTARKVSIAGGLLSFAGLFLGAFARSVMEMILSFGLLTGIGVGLTTTPAVVITSLYFKKRRALASAICLSGNSLGAILFPPLIELLLSQYGFQGAMIILAALQLNVCAASMLFRPIAVHALVQKKKRKEKEKKERMEIELKEKNNSRMVIRRYSLLMMKEKLTSKSAREYIADEEVHNQVSFLRSSRKSSIPDLIQYARSWTVSRKHEADRQYFHRSAYPSLDSRLALTNSVDMLNGTARRKGSTKCRAVDIDTVSSKSKSYSYNISTGPCTAHSHHSVIHKEPSAMDDGKFSLTEDEALIHLISVDETVTPANVTFVQLDLGNSVDIRNTDVESPRIDGSKLETEEIIAGQNKKNCCLFLCTFLDCSLMKSSKFLLVNLSVFLVGAVTPHAVFYLPAFVTSLNMDRTAVVSVLSIAAVTDLVGRLGTGFIADRNILNINIIYAICVGLGGSGLVFLPLVQSYKGLVFLMLLYGFGVGAWFVMVPTILAKDHGAQRLAATYGLVRMFHGFMNFISPQISGLLIDVTGKYENIYFFMGSCMLAGSVVMIVKFISSLSVSRSNRCRNG